MLKISRLADYGIIIMMCFEESNELQSAAAISEKTNLSQTTVSKILKLLSDADILTSHKGVNGGYQCAKSIEHVSLASIIEAIDGPVALTECNTHDKQCAQAENCSVKDNWHIINDVIFQTLKSLSLKDMANPLKGLKVELKPVIKLNVKT